VYEVYLEQAAQKDLKGLPGKFFSESCLSSQHWLKILDPTDAGRFKGVKGIGGFESEAIELFMR
jgi:hypothetical protein